MESSEAVILHKFINYFILPQGRKKKINTAVTQSKIEHDTNNTKINRKLKHKMIGIPSYLETQGDTNASSSNPDPGPDLETEGILFSVDK